MAGKTRGNAKRSLKASKTQHRPRREDAKGKELSSIKKENKQLHRQVARLQKQVAKGIELKIEEEPTKTLADAEGQSPIFDHECEKCRSLSIGVLKVPTGILLVCKECGHRRKK